MKKRFLIAVLPALMALSACAGVNQKGIAKNEKLFVEDTLAHDELFENKNLIQLNPRRTIDVVSDNVPLVGIQFSDESEGKINIRFVAAINVDGADLDAKKAALEHTTAVWTRTMYDGSGDIAKDEANITAKKAYTRINGGGDDISAGVGAFADYDFFVVYTMMNIPVSGGSDASNYYLNAYLTIDDTVNNEFDKVSKLVSTTVNQAKQVAIDLNDAKQTGYFLKGKTSLGAEIVVEKDDPTKGDNPENNFASFTLDVATNDSFVIVNKGASKFVIYDASCLRGDTSNFAFSSANGKIKANLAESVVLYLNNSGEIYSSLSGEHYQLFINDVLSPIENIIPDGKTDKAWFSGVSIASDSTPVKIKMNGSQVGEITVPASGTYNIGINSGDSIWYNGDLVTVNITVDCNGKGDVAGWGGKVFIIGDFCEWSTTNANAIELEETSSKVWTGSVSWKYGYTYTYQVRLNNDAGTWGDENNWYPGYNKTFVPSTTNTSLSETW